MRAVLGRVNVKDCIIQSKSSLLGMYLSLMVVAAADNEVVVTCRLFVGAARYVIHVSL